MLKVKLGPFFRILVEICQFSFCLFFWLIQQLSSLSSLHSHRIVIQLFYGNGNATQNLDDDDDDDDEAR